MRVMLLADFVQAMKIKEAETNKEPMQAFILVKANHLETLKMTKFSPNTLKSIQKLNIQFKVITQELCIISIHLMERSMNVCILYVVRLAV